MPGATTTDIPMQQAHNPTELSRASLQLLHWYVSFGCTRRGLMPSSWLIRLTLSTYSVCDSSLASSADICIGMLSSWLCVLPCIDKPEQTHLARQHMEHAF